MEKAQRLGIKPANPPQKAPGFSQSIVQGVAQPFLRLASNVRAGIDMAKAKGTGAELQKNLDEIENRDYDYGYFGKAKPVKNPLQAAGVGTEIASNFIGGTGAVGVAKAGFKGLVKQGFKQGLKYGAATGATQAFGESLGRGDSVGKTVKNTAFGTAAGAVTGGVTGATLPVASLATRGVAGKVREVIDPTLKKARITQDAIDITLPVMNKKERITAFERAGLPGGVEKKGALGTYKPVPTRRDIDVAKSVENLVSRKNGPLDNIASVNQEITNISENQITPLLQNNPSIFNLKTLDARLKTIEKPDFIKADPVLDRTYDLVRQRMLDVVSKGKKDMLGLWQSRKEFDAIAEAQLKNLNPESAQASVVKKAVLDTRRAVNEFIAENTPRGDASFKELMRRLSNMYEARGNIAEQNQALLNKNAITRWVKSNPHKAHLIGEILGGIGLAGSGAYILHNVVGD